MICNIYKFYPKQTEGVFPPSPFVTIQRIAERSQRHPRHDGRAPGGQDIPGKILPDIANFIISQTLLTKRQIKLYS